MYTFALQPNRTLARASSASVVGCALAWAMGGIGNFNAIKALRTTQPGAQSLSRVRDKRS
jgi:hypothetical protein